MPAVALAAEDHMIYKDRGAEGKEGLLEKVLAIRLTLTSAMMLSARTSKPQRAGPGLQSSPYILEAADFYRVRTIA